MLKKILLLSQFAYPDKTGTGKIVSELIFSINKKKFDSNILSSKECYNDPLLKLGEFEKINGVKIYRTFMPLMSKNNGIGRVYNYIMFFIFATIKCIFKGLHKDRDIIISLSNPPIMPLLGALLKGNRKFIYIIHDLYPDIAVKMGVIKTNNFMAVLMRLCNNYVFRKADKIVVLGNDMKSYLKELYNVENEKIEVIPNWSNKINNKNNLGKNKKLRLLYSGNLGKFHSLEMLINLAKVRADIDVIFIGEGAQKKKLIEMSRNIENVIFHGFLEEKDYVQMLNDADCLVVSLEKNLSGMAVPSKFYTYLAAGKPIISISDRNTEMSYVINKYQCGFVVDHGDIDKMINCVDILKKDCEYKLKMGNNSEMVFKQNYEKNLIISRYEKLFSEII